MDDEVQIDHGDVGIIEGTVRVVDKFKRTLTVQLEDNLGVTLPIAALVVTGGHNIHLANILGIFRGIYFVTDVTFGHNKTTL